jgi:hypothetical protein
MSTNDNYESLTEQEDILVNRYRSVSRHHPRRPANALEERRTCPSEDRPESHCSYARSSNMARVKLLLLRIEKRLEARHMDRKPS